MRIARWFGSGLVVATLFTASAAWGASETGWYYGISGGKSNGDFIKPELDELADIIISTAGTVVTASSTLEDSDTAWALFFGYQFSPYFAVEGGYLNLGTFPYRYAGTVDRGGTTGVVPSTFNFESKEIAYPIAVVGILPIGPVFEVHGRVGLLFSNPEVKITSTAGSDSIADKFGASSQDLFYGAGFAANLGETWSISLDYAKYNDVGDGDIIAETDFDSISLSLIYRLGPF